MMKKLLLIICGFFMLNSLFSQDNNILINLNDPAYGVKILANWPNATTGWARSFMLANQNNTENFFGLGAMGNCVNGISNFNYGWIGKDYNQAFMTFLANGNVGIGPATPNAKLDLGNGYGANGEKFLIYNDDNSGPFSGTKVGFYMDRFSLSNNSTFVFPTANSDPGSFIIASKNTSSTTLIPRFTVLGENGNVGIGTTNPSNVQGWRKVLDVHGAEHSKILATTTENGVITGIFSHGIDWNGIVGRIGTESNHDLRLMAGYGTDYVTIKTNGNVGVGTINPATKLEVYGGHGDCKFRLFSTGDGGNGNASLDMWASEPGVTYSGAGLGNNVNGHPYYGRRNANLGQSYIRFYDGSILFSTGTENAIERISIQSNGNVGIGTTNPGSYKLAVEGKIGAHEIVVTTAGWADFVFETDYNLMPLNELGTYIQQNKHLPEIPTTAEVQENGISVGEMNAKELSIIKVYKFGSII